MNLVDVCRLVEEEALLVLIDGSATLLEGGKPLAHVLPGPPLGEVIHASRSRADQTACLGAVQLPEAGLELASLEVQFGEILLHRLPPVAWCLADGVPRLHRL
eukprot:1563080-Pyramimonas_sp.AAC.1